MSDNDDDDVDKDKDDDFTHLISVCSSAMIPAALGEWLLWLWFALIDQFSSRWRWGPLKFLQNKARKLPITFLYWN